MHPVVRRATEADLPAVAALISDDTIEHARKAGRGLVQLTADKQ